MWVSLENCCCCLFFVCVLNYISFLFLLHCDCKLHSMTFVTKIYARENIVSDSKNKIIKICSLMLHICFWMFWDSRDLNTSKLQYKINWLKYETITIERDGFVHFHLKILKNIEKMISFSVYIIHLCLI